MAKLLLIEDDKDLARMVEQWLSAQRFLVDVCHNGKEGLDYLLINEYELAVVDWELPEMTGIEIVKEYRRKGGQIPIIFLTGKGDIADKESGFDTGCDDYLTKPFSVRELTVRIQALLRRPRQVAAQSLKNGDVELDPVRHRVLRNGVEVTLSPKDFELLEFLMRHCDQVFSSEALLARLWPSDSEATSNALRSAIKRIRQKLDTSDDDANSIIRNIHKVGYRIR